MELELEVDVVVEGPGEVADQAVVDAGFHSRVVEGRAHFAANRDDPRWSAWLQAFRVQNPSAFGEQPDPRAIDSADLEPAQRHFALRGTREIGCEPQLARRPADILESLVGKLCSLRSIESEIGDRFGDPFGAGESQRFGGYDPAAPSAAPGVNWRLLRSLGKDDRPSIVAVEARAGRDLER